MQRKSRVIQILPVLILIQFCAGSAFGQAPPFPEPPQWEFTGFTGASLGHDFLFPTLVSGNGQVTSRTIGMRYASGYLIGVRVTQNVSDYWAAHLEYSFANQPLLYTNLSPATPSLSLGQYTSHFMYGVSYLPRPYTKRFQPYGTAAAGAALYFLSGHSRETARLEGVPLRDSWELAFNVGGGLKQRVADYVALNFDVKDQISSVPSYGLPRNAQIINGQFIPGLSRNGLFNNWQISVGISVQWDD